MYQAKTGEENGNIFAGRHTSALFAGGAIGENQVTKTKRDVEIPKSSETRCGSMFHLEPIGMNEKIEISERPIHRPWQEEQRSRRLDHTRILYERRRRIHADAGPYSTA
ncbi:hypothetical protein GZH47_14040 [Paenibacillus rhizovicinus]|uniref:Uncharacterized protein n=1 Tax=Paenibacillus rhizovicinus TaxID=2704463 RepID=A0A6C0P1T3_9BACL|nr:hypothetical protein [Paenibacillus rhizovicinus]QHW31843.1 hypothetical protein GZH47_14040 [Paenibacillus rhizovicinus]